MQNEKKKIYIKEVYVRSYSLIFGILRWHVKFNRREVYLSFKICCEKCLKVLLYLFNIEDIGNWMLIWKLDALMTFQREIGRVKFKNAKFTSVWIQEFEGKCWKIFKTPRLGVFEVQSSLEINWKLNKAETEKKNR